AVAEDEPVGLDLGRERLPPARADRPPHLEDVGEVGREVEGEREVEGGAVEAADAEALVEDAVVDEDGPGEVERAVGDGAPVEGEVGVGEVHAEDAVVLADAGVEEGGRVALEVEDVEGEVAGAAVVEP